MLLTLYNETMGSGNPSSQTGLLPGGAGVINTGTTPAPFLAFPTAERLIREVLDITSTGGVPTPAVNGNLLSFASNVAQTGAALWHIPPAAQGFHLTGQVGIVFKAGSTLAIDELPLGSGVGAEVIVSGPAQALCVTPGTTAITPGTVLATDGNGNLQPLQPPAAAPTPTVTPTGGAATSWSYALVAVSTNGTFSAVGTSGTTAAGPATLSSTAYNTVSWTPVPDAVGYLVVRTVGTGTSPVGTLAFVAAGASSFVDNGNYNVVQPNTTATQPFATFGAAGTPTVVQVTGATAGTTTYSYKITAIAPNGVWGVQSTAGSVTTGAATLSATQGNKITWTPTPGASLYAVSRTTGGATQGFIGYASTAAATSGFVDYGITATTYAQNTTPLPTPQSGVVLARSMGTLAAGITTPTLVPVFVGVE